MDNCKYKRRKKMNMIGLVDVNICRSYFFAFLCSWGYVTLEEMKNVDIRTIDKSRLVNIRDVRVDTSLL
jgi:hypothetical protein